MRRQFRSWVLVLCVLFTVLPTAAFAQDSSGLLGRIDPSDTYDLSAMMLTPEDLADEGLEGYGLRDGWTDTLDDELTQALSSDSLSPAEVRDLFEEAGYQQSRAETLELPSEDDPDFAARRVTIWIDQYGEPDLLPDIVDLYLDFGNAEEVEGTETIGDYSRIVQLAEIDATTSVPVEYMNLVFAYGDQIAQIEIAEFKTQLPDTSPTAKEIEALAQRLLKRIEQVRDDGAPGLDSLVLRLATDNDQSFYYNDYYTRLDGETLATYGESADDIDTRDEEYEDAGIISQYVLDQGVRESDEQRLQWAVRLRQFDRTRDATAWLEDQPDAAARGAVSNDLDVEDLEVQEIDDLGDDALLMTMYVPDADLYLTMLYVRLGDQVVSASVYSAMGIYDSDALLDIGAEQVECIEDGACDAEYPVPDEMLDFIGA